LIEVSLKIELLLSIVIKEKVKKKKYRKLKNKKHFGNKNLKVCSTSICPPLEMLPNPD
jgi:hypothetical protein